MTRLMQTAIAGAALGLALSVCGLAAAADRPSPQALSDSQLDRVTGGGDPVALANGTGKADGKSARSGATVASYVQTSQPGLSGGATGLVTASATAGAGALATATSSLSLSVSLP